MATFQNCNDNLVFKDLFGFAKKLLLRHVHTYRCPIEDWKNCSSILHFREKTPKTFLTIQNVPEGGKRILRYFK